MDPRRLLIAGDTHGNLQWIGSLSKLASRNGCDAVVQLGDFGFWPDPTLMRRNGHAEINHRWLDAVNNVAALHGVHWLVIDGNHDAHPLARDAFQANNLGQRSVRDRIVWADRGAVWEWAGTRFGALGGAVSIDRALRTEGRDWWPTERISRADVDLLVERAGPAGLDVLFSHDAPRLPAGLRPITDPVLATACAESISLVDDAVNRTAPSRVFHGHYHLRTTSTIHYPHGPVEVVGLASDFERHVHQAPWIVFDLADKHIAARIPTLADAVANAGDECGTGR